MMDNDKTMSLGEATAIFDMAFRYRRDLPDDEIMQAIALTGWVTAFRRKTV